MLITSPRNPIVKYVRSLERSRVRQEEGVYLVEGIRLVREALDSRQHATLALYDPDALGRTPAGAALAPQLGRWAERCHEVDQHVLSVAAQTETPAGVLAVLRRPESDRLAGHAGDRLGLILDCLADPGNVGAILRTAAAAGVDYAVSLPGTVDLFAPKVVRAGMGAHFRLPLYPDISWQELAVALPDVPMIAIDAGGSDLVQDVSWPAQMSLVVGNEAHGLSTEAQERVTLRVRIPMRSGVESLNAAVAASIVIYVASGILNPRPEVRYRIRRSAY